MVVQEEELVVGGFSMIWKKAETLVHNKLPWWRVSEWVFWKNRAGKLECNCYIAKETKTREASHNFTWYTGSMPALNQQLFVCKEFPIYQIKHKQCYFLMRKLHAACQPGGLKFYWLIFHFKRKMIQSSLDLQSKSKIQKVKVR